MRLAVVAVILASCGDAFQGPCGNGALDPFEECDDGNIESGDLCSANCTREPSCGDRIIDSPRENCDDGNTIPGDNCDENCRTESVCGDLDIEPGEMCEDGNADPGDGCSEACTIEYKVTAKVAWRFVTAADLVDHGCPAGVDTIEITTRVLRDDDSVANEVVERLPCTDGMREKPWFVGRYRVLVRALDANGEAFAPPTEDTIDLRGTQRDVIAQIVVDGGSVRIGWRLIDATSGHARTCAQLGVLDVGVVASASGFTRGHFVLCPAGRATSQPLPAGNYTLTLTAFDNLGTELGTRPVPVAVTARGGIVDAGTYDVTID